MKYTSTAFMLFSMTALAILTSGCFVIGTAIGSSVAKNKNMERQVIQPELVSLNALQVNEWLEIVKKDGKIIEGKYVGTSSDSIPIIKLKIMGRQANQMFVLHEIDHIVVGHKAEGSKLAGTLFGLVIDGIIWTIVAIAINNAVSP